MQAAFKVVLVSMQSFGVARENQSFRPPPHDFNRCLDHTVIPLRVHC